VVLWGLAGFQGARLLRPTTGDETGFVSLTFFDHRYKSAFEIS
jgi:heme-degrading monooxygenase HmoA